MKKEERKERGNTGEREGRKEGGREGSRPWSLILSWLPLQAAGTSAARDGVPHHPGEPCGHPRGPA